MNYKEIDTGDYKQEVAAIYCRLSKEDEDKLKAGDESASIQNQKMMLVDYALERGFYVYDIYSDDDYTGFDQSRPDFNRMLTDAKSKKFNIIICKAQSRFTRDMELVERYIHGLFPLLGIRFIGTADNVDTNIKGNKKSRQINGLINEWYSEDLSENIKKVFNIKMKKGQFLGAFAPYGYKKNPEDNHHLIIDEEAATVVRKIFNYVIQGLGINRICDKLTEDGIPTPYVYKKMQGLNIYNPNHQSYSSRGLWARTTIRKMLRNRVYVGDMVQGRERKVSYKTTQKKHVPKDEWIIVPDCHEPIIDQETFNLVQNILNQRKNEVASKKTGRRKIHLFAGKLRCKDCGSSITRINGASGGRTYLYCKLHYKTKRELCSKHGLILEELIKTVTHRIKYIISSYLTTGGICELTELMSLDDDIKKHIQEVNKKISGLDIKINKLMKAISMLYVDKANGKMSEEEYNELKQSLQQEKDILEKRINVLKLEHDELVLRSNNNDNLETLIHKYSNFEKLTHEIVNEFINYIEIGEKDGEGTQEIIIHWNF